MIMMLQGSVEVEGDHWNLLWMRSHVTQEILKHMKFNQKVNHFPRSSEITRKDRLAKNVKRMQHIFGREHFDFLPETFVLPEEKMQLKVFMEREAQENGSNSITPFIVKVHY